MIKLNVNDFVIHSLNKCLLRDHILGITNGTKNVRGDIVTFKDLEIRIIGSVSHSFKQWI